MSHVSPRLAGVRLPRPRLLPATIVIISALLTVKSALLVQAIAEENTGLAKQGEAPSRTSVPDQTVGPERAANGDPQPPKGNPRSGVGDKSTCPSGAAPSISDAERTILLDLRHRRETLDARARELDLRDAEINAADRRLGQRVQQLSALQTRLESLELDRQQHTAENWTGLVKIYESMKPRDAAAIFDALDMQVLLQVLDRMQDRRAASVLAAMQPDRARLATQMLAEMRTRSVTPPGSAAPASNPK